MYEVFWNLEEGEGASGGERAAGVREEQHPLRQCPLTILGARVKALGS
jgi:hypothetical protein